MSRRYLLSLVVMVLVLVCTAFVVMWVSPASFRLYMPLLALYFGVISGAQHWVVTRSMKKSPRAFVQYFLGSVTAVLFLHIAVLFIYLFTHPNEARRFAITFLIGYAISLVFETVALVQFVRHERNRRNQEQNQ